MGFTIFHKHIPSGSWPMARRRPICLHILAGGVQWDGVGLIMSCALRSHTHATLDTFSCNSTDTPQVDNFTSVCPVRWKNVSNVAGTQMLERSWQNLKGFLSKPMCLKYKDKGHSKMHPSVPEYILYVYIYIWCWRQSLGTTHPRNFQQSQRTAVTHAMEKKACGTELVASNPKTLKINTSVW